MSTGNTERIRAELQKAAEAVPELFIGYRESLVQAALECVTATAEHDDRRLNVNQRFDGQVQQIAAKLATTKEGETP